MNTVNRGNAASARHCTDDLPDRVAVIEGSLTGVEGVLVRESQGRCVLELCDIAPGLFLEVDRDVVRMA